MTAIQCTTLKDRVSARQLPSLSVVDCAYKAFLDYNSKTNAGIDSFNVSAMNDFGVGIFNCLLITPFGYWHIPAGSAHDAGFNWCLVSLVGHSAGGISWEIFATATPTLVDSAVVTVQSCGRLA